MKALTYKSFTLLFFLLTTFHLATANTNEEQKSKKEFTKTVKKQYNISTNGEVSLSNRHGKVNVKTWDNNEVKINVLITVQARDESAANLVFDRISIDFSSGSDYVKAETQIASVNKSWWSWGSGSNDFSIDYEVFMPKSNDLNLSNKYGHSVVDALEGNANVSVKYGNIRMEGVGDELNLTVGYGNGTVLEAGDVAVNLKYGKLQLKKSKDISIESKYSKITIGRAYDVRSTSKYDTYVVGEIKDFNNQGKYDNFEIDYADNISASSKYTDYHVNTMTQSADFDLSYGGATIDNISKSFSEVRLNGSYADYKIKIESGANYRLDATSTYAGIRYPDVMDVTYEKEKGSNHDVEGFVGGNRDAKSLVKVRLSYGGLRLR